MYKFNHAFEEESNVGNAERIASGGAGAALFVKGIRDLRTSPVKSGIELAASAYLLFRAVTAFCPLRDVMTKEYPVKAKAKKKKRYRSFSYNEE